MEDDLPEKCIIWRTPARLDGANGDYVDLTSNRAGGAYRTTNNAKLILDDGSTYQDDHRVVLTNWLLEQRRAGRRRPTVDSYLLEDVKSWKNHTVLERVGRVVEWLHDEIPALGRTVPVGPAVPGHKDLVGLFKNNELLTAFSGSKDIFEVLELLDFAAANGFVGVDHFLKGKGGQWFLTFEGYRHVEVARQKSASNSQAFVAMWFSPEMDKIYQDGIAPAINDAGYEPVKIDLREHNNKIDDEIIAEIRRSKFVVADFTSQVLNKSKISVLTHDTAIARGGVYYEAGFAKGLGKEVIWTVRKDVLPFVHFDTRQFAHIDWIDAADLRVRLARRISATLGDGPLKKP